MVLGISPDNSASQLKFKERYSLPYTLLADSDKRIAHLFGVMKEKNMYGKKVMGVGRTTFVIDGSGKIARVFENVRPEGHAEEVLAALRK